MRQTELSRDRDRCAAAPVSGPLCRRTLGPGERSSRVAEAPQRRSLRQRLDVHTSGCGSKITTTLCFVINMSRY
jgi:hypothetical protein